METQTLTFVLEREATRAILYRERTNGKPPAVDTLTLYGFSGSLHRVG